MILLLSYELPLNQILLSMVHARKMFPLSSYTSLCIQHIIFDWMPQLLPVRWKKIKEKMY